MISIVALCISILAALAGLTAVFITGRHDGPIEEACEEVIKSQTGIDVDLTPSSPELSRKGDSDGDAK